MVVEKMKLLKKHMVHPTSISITRDSELRIPYGSWCTPENTPTRTVLTQTVSSLQAKSRTRDEPTEFQSESKIFPSSDIKLISSEYRIKDEIQYFEKDIEEEESLQIQQDEIETNKTSFFTRKSVPDVETPQSPVPSSPTRKETCKGFLRFPTLCDPFLPIDPQGRAYISWLFLVTFCYSYNAWCVVLRATFPYQTPENLPLWMVADYFSDIIYIVDVLMVKPRLMFLHEGFWVDEPERTRKNYRQKLQYKFDVLSLLPLDLLYVFFGTDVVILRLPRVLKLQSFWEFHQAMDRVLSNPYVVRIGKTLFYIFYLIHLNACAYYAMSVYEGLASNGWVYDNKGNAYIICFYFATKTATSIGKNPKPENAVEYLYMTGAWLMGVFVFALLIGQIRDIIATATRARTEYRKTVDGCSRYLRRLNMPASLQRRVASWFSYTWSQQRCFDEAKILNSLPYNMKRDVALEVHMSTLSKVQIFRDCSDSLLRDLVLQLRPVSCLPGDAVVRRGDVGDHMYIIKCGECCVMSQDEKEVLATLREGSVFGEISLLGIEGLKKRTATVRSRGYSNLFALSRNDLDYALNQHKEAAHILRLRADQIIKENSARQAKQRRLEKQLKKSAGSQISDNAVARRLSSVSSNDSSMKLEKRNRSASGQSKRRLSIVSENKVKDSSVVDFVTDSRVRTPLPTIILSAE